MQHRCRSRQKMGEEEEISGRGGYKDCLMIIGAVLKKTTTRASTKMMAMRIITAGAG